MASSAAAARPASGQRHSAAALAEGKPLLETRHRWLLTIGIMGAMIMQILDTTIANVALPHMMTSLGATVDTVTWVLTSYIVATAIALPATGWLSDRLGSRNLFLIATAGFIIASMLCGIATSLEEMVIFRVFQGVFAAFINPLSQTSMLDINAPENAAKAMSVWGMGVMVGPIMGPVLGGWLTESYNWRWVFYVNVPVGIATFAILWFLLPSRPKARRSFDYAGFIYLGVAVAAFQLMLDRGQSEDWFDSWEVIVEGLAALAFTWLAIFHFATAKKPLFDRALFRNRNLVTGLMFMLVVGISTMAPMALLPPMLQNLFGYPVIDTGMMMAPRGVGVLFTMWLAGRLMGKVDTRIVIMAGLIIFGISLRQMAGYSLEQDYWPVVTAGFVQGLGMGLVFMPLNAMAFATLDGRYRTDGSSLLNLFRSIGQSAGISMVTVLLARNTQTSHADLAQHVTGTVVSGFDLNMLRGLGTISDAAMTMIDGMVNKQAAMIAYIDDFYLMSWISFGAVPLVLLLQKPKGKIEVVHSE
ncbi:MAG: EmrB/QacA family drug resistance transporter [Sphingomonas sp.]|nr:EmrB/QacA family drug resistance transporter [Sphingomonas sp.]